MPTTTVNGVEINYREAGEGFPIVLIHGYTGNLRNWALAVPVLTEHFRTISLDLRGHGHSGKPTQPEDYSLDLMASDVYGLLQHLGVGECYLMGHSMGGYVSQHLILSHPELVGALVLVDTAAEPLPAHSQEREPLLEIARAHGMEAAFDEELRRTPPHPAFQSNPRYTEIWKELFLLTSKEAYVYCAEAMATRRDLRNELRSVSVPTLIVCGANDEPFLEASRHMHESIPGSELVIIPTAGHSPQFETPAEFNRVLLSFLSRVHETVAAKS
jgi:pimeloyl-ACP methyl ester carboxylesterase